MIFIKLQKFLQQLGYSRRAADKQIFNGKVKVNGKTVTVPWHDVEENDEIFIEGKAHKVKYRKNYVYYVLHKPVGYVTSLKDPKEKMTISKLISKIKEPVKPAGRLDKDVSGVLILTNDGDLINILTHARYGVEKVYIAKVSKRLSKSSIFKIEKGVYNEGEFLKCKKAFIKKLGKNHSIVKVIMTEGKKHEVKRLFKSIGCEVLELKRVSHGPIHISLVPKPGEIKKITGIYLKKLLNLKHLEKLGEG
ncbi:rRNA pseudouridine synthase [Thermosipho ferrireducens]|uniref:rRNA pseudouridine synthase n=1 Tax=Thermosipho ferrireducens TaxID=2571116 RepID=A0ABX7S4S3_9BACT|nr:pseudouridine synthase [Thermosipho ferrireducens]QTA37474.1 rRNA pseudouridine synthase [Thermosipho ferrireducens]